MNRIEILVPTIQRPRFRGEGQSVHDAPVPDGRTYQTDALCTSCKNLLARSRIIFGSKRKIVSSVEFYKFSPSLDELKCSAIELHCHLCTIVWWELTRDDSSEILDRVKRSKVTLRIENHRDFGDGPHFQLFCKGLPRSSEKVCLMGQENSTNFEPKLYSPRGNIQTLSTAYMERARYWLRECEAKHFECRARNPNFMPTRIIHVGTSKTLIPVHLEITAGFRSLCQERRYCSLSHRWGGAELRLTTKNLDALMEEIPMQDLSKAASDAILVTRKLGIKYLWIDSLCIMQDLAEDWTKEAAVMADIYENSVCTIAAAGEAIVGDNATFEAQNPLIDKFCRLAGSPKDGLYVIGYAAEYARANFWGNGLEGTIRSPLVQHQDLFSRGWVFQERILSPKIIFFGDREVLWSCRYGRASEDKPDGLLTREIFGPLVSEEQMSPDRVVNSDFEKLRRSDFIVPEVNDAYGLHKYSNMWYEIVSDYSSCKLSHEEDRLVALSGLAQRIQSKTGWQYLAGLWRQTLFYDLLWYRTEEAGSRRASYIAPTWSWASVAGKFKLYNSIHSWSETKSREDTMHPLVDIISAETETHPLDATKTGKVTGGRLVLRGCLKSISLFGSLYTYRDPTCSPNGLSIQISRQIQGWLRFDVVIHELWDVLLMPLYGDIFEKSSFVPGNEKGAGLALIPKANCYERVGFFSIYCYRYSKKPILPPPCLKLGEKEIIIIV